MKKKLLISIGSIFVLILGISSYIWFNKDNNTQVYENEKEKTNEQVVGSNWLSMMYETGPGTGEYSESKSSLWPESGYIFNENLSGCENGGELSWNSETNTVNLLSNKSDSCYVYFDVYIIPQINNVTTSNIETDSITLTVNATNGNNPVTTYYYSNNNGSSYVSSTSNTYTFTGLDLGTEYNFSVYVEDSLGYASEVYTLSETTDDTPPTFADTCRETGSNTLACYIATQYTVDGENGLYYHDGVGDYTNADQEAADNSYRYAGADPNNYVCFGSDDATCPEDNLYRIIGVFDGQVKLIKATSYGNYYWSGSSSNTSNSWGDSTLNTNILNGTYLNNMGSTWSNLIATHTWKVGGMNGTSTPKTVYDYEVGANSSTTYNAKIGLMYISDYGFAASNSHWTTALYDYESATSDNWMHMGLWEWTISCNSVASIEAAFVVIAAGFVTNDSVYFTNAVRPSFYLNSSVQYSSGSGTSSDPIRIN